MSEIIMGGGTFPGFDAMTMRGTFAFRHKVFFNKLGWDVETRSELEYDLFDTLNPVYMLAVRQQRSALSSHCRLASWKSWVAAKRRAATIRSPYSAAKLEAGYIPEAKKSPEQCGAFEWMRCPGVNRHR